MTRQLNIFAVPCNNSMLTATMSSHVTDLHVDLKMKLHVNPSDPLFSNLRASTKHRSNRSMTTC